MVCDDTNHGKKQQSAALSYFVTLYAVDERGHRVSDWGGSAPEGWGEIAYVELRNPEGDYSRKHDRQARSWKEGITWWEGLAGTPKNRKTETGSICYLFISASMVCRASSGVINCALVWCLNHVVCRLAYCRVWVLICSTASGNDRVPSITSNNSL